MIKSSFIVVLRLQISMLNAVLSISGTHNGTDIGTERLNSNTFL